MQGQQLVSIAKYGNSQISHREQDTTNEFPEFLNTSRGNKMYFEAF